MNTTKEYQNKLANLPASDRESILNLNRLYDDSIECYLTLNSDICHLDPNSYENHFNAWKAISQACIDLKAALTTLQLAIKEYEHEQGL